MINKQVPIRTILYFMYNIFLLFYLKVKTVKKYFMKR